MTWVSGAPFTSLDEVKFPFIAMGVGDQENRERLKTLCVHMTEEGWVKLPTLDPGSDQKQYRWGMVLLLSDQQDAAIIRLQHKYVWETKKFKAHYELLVP